MSFIEPKTARSAPTIRRQYYQAWGRMLAELRRLNEKAVDVLDDPEIADAVENLLGQGEAIAVCMVTPDSFALNRRDTVSIPHYGRIS